MKIKAHIIICRSIGGIGEFINVEIRDSSSHLKFFQAQMSMESFARAVTGQGYIEIDAEVRGLQHVGKTLIREERRAICPVNTYSKKELREWLTENRQEEGWIVDTYLGGQDSVSYVGNQTVLNYCVYRYE